MDGEIILKGSGLLISGALFVWLGIDGWHHRREERISLIEESILKEFSENDPLPFNRWDKVMGYVQPVLMLIFGPAMMFMGANILFG